MQFDQRPLANNAVTHAGASAFVRDVGYQTDRSVGSVTNITNRTNVAHAFGDSSAAPAVQMPCRFIGVEPAPRPGGLV